MCMDVYTICKEDEKDCKLCSVQSVSLMST